MTEVLFIKTAMAEAIARGWSVAHVHAVGSSSARLRELFLEALPHMAPSAPEVLKPRASTPKVHPSPTRTFGEGRFPFHCDSSHQETPPHFVALYCAVDAQRRPTHLLEWNAIQTRINRQEALSLDVFAVINGRRSFYDTVLSPTRGFVRWDPTCMHPATRSAQSLWKEITNVSHSIKPLNIEWTPGMILFWNNWRVLHARGLPAQPGMRVLMRVMLSSDGETDYACL